MSDAKPSSRILLVDDNSSNLLLLRSLLEMNDYADVLETTDPREVLGLCQTRRPDLLLLDLKMPHLDGLQVLQLLGPWMAQDHLPVIMVTAQNDQENKMRALELGARDFLGKPFDPSEILARVKNLLEMRHLNKSLEAANAGLASKVQSQDRELADLSTEFFHKLLMAAEFRDNSTGGHIVRIGRLAQTLGRHAGLDEDAALQLYHGSMMHDIGKIAIPDAILNKPGPLTPEEWEVMRRHSEHGARILSDSHLPVMRLGETIALSHHEKWDGSGYPNGWKGERIPLESRITSVCDIFDALLAVRPYKKAWTLEEAAAELQRQAGAGLDPRLVGLFLEHLDEFAAVLREEP